jgi:hypothetical protein
VRLLLLLILGLVIILIKIPRRLTAIEMYSTVFFILYFALVFDAIFKGKHELYHYIEPGVNYTDFLVRIGIFPITSILFLTFFPFAKGILTKILYLTIWVFVLTVMEWGFLQTRLLEYNGWKLYYSVFKYLLLYCTVYLNLKITRKLLSDEV